MDSAEPARQESAEGFRGWWSEFSDPDPDLPDGGLEYWRERILFYIILAAVGLGMFAYIPSMIAILKEGHYVLMAVDTAAYLLTILILVLRRRLSYNLRAGLSIFLLYAIAVGLLLARGPTGGGLIWLFAYGAMTPLLLGRKVAVGALVVTGLTLGYLGWAISAGWMSWSVASSAPLVDWLVTGVNILFLNVLFTVSTVVLLDGLESTLNRHREAQASLEAGRDQLVEANRQLEEEVAERIRVQTEWERTQTLLRQSQKMEAVGTLAGGIAHDFNNILAGIMGYTELAQTSPGLDDNLRRNLARVLEAGERGRALVQRILSFSRQTEQDLAPVRLGPIVSEALELIRATIPTTIAIEEQIANQTDPVLADPVQIHQVIMNLCTNAAQAMPSGGRLRVGLKEVEIGSPSGPEIETLTDGRYLELTVADSGRGMDAATLNRAFEPFFTTKEKGDGTGLGLAVVHGIVTRAGGEITVRSELGRGTDFRVYLPLVSDSGELERPSLSATPTGTERILIIDDEQALAEMNKELLSQLGYRVTARTSSLEAWELIRNRSREFDLLLTDQAMPHLSGLELAARVREIAPDLPIVLLTGFSQDLAPAAVRAARIHQVVHKPVALAELSRIIREALDESP